MIKTPKLIRKALIGLVGSLLILIGILLLVLPGPGLLMIALGLFVLSWEFTWAEKYYLKIEHHAQRLLERFRKNL